MMPVTPQKKRKMKAPDAPRKRQRYASKASKATQTRGGKRNKMTQTSRAKGKCRQKAVGGELGGKFLRDGSSNKFKQYTKNGAVLSKEVGTLATATIATYPIYVGHATHADSTTIHELFWMTAVRELYGKAGVQFTDFGQPGPGAYTIVVYYILGPDNGAKSTFNVITVGKTYKTIANELFQLFRTQWDTPSGAQNLYVCQLELVYSTGATQALVASIDLTDVTVHVLCKSDLKLQNRTNAAGADDDINSSENVANQPLYGKSYSGKGTGLIPKVGFTGAVQPLNCSTTGTLTQNPGGICVYAPVTGNASFYGEPPLPTLFTPRPLCSKASLLPGVIKASTLVSELRIRQQDMWKTLIGDAYSTQISNANQRRGYGKFHIIALEKVICVTASDTVPSVGVEMNQRMGLRFTKARKQHVSEIFKGQYFI